MRKSRGVKSSVVLMLAVAAAAVMLNAGCEDSELARLLGLSKKKNDLAAQLSQQQDNKSVSENEKETASENSKTTENSDGKESGSEDGTQSENDSSNQNSENTSAAQNNNADGSNQDGNLQQAQSDGNTNEIQTPALQDAVLPQVQAGEAPDNNYKTVTIYGTKHPNDLGYAGTWEFLETNKITYLTITALPEIGGFNQLEGIWSFNSHVQGNKIYLNFRYRLNTSNESYRFAFEIVADGIKIERQVSNVYNIFSGIFTESWNTSSPPRTVLFTCAGADYWISQSGIPEIYTCVNVNAVLSLHTNWYTTPQPDAANTWRRTK
jgi:hypothetical protein